MNRLAMTSLKLERFLDQNTIKHPTALLHFERQLSTFEQGILFLAVHIVAKTERDSDGFYYLNKSLVRAVMKQDGNQDYSKISQAVDKVSKTDLKFNFLGQDRTFDSYEAPLIVGRAKSRRRGTIAFTTDPIIEKLIKNPVLFSRLNIYFITALYDVSRGYAFYALFKDHLDRTKEQVVTFEYWALREYLGVEKTSYSTFKAFKQWVLKPLLLTINERTDLHLDYKPIKNGRSLSHLQFTITPQAWQLPLFDRQSVEKIIEELELATNHSPVLKTITKEEEVPKTEDNRPEAGLIDKCVKLGVTSKTVERAIKKFGLQGVFEIVDLTESRFSKMDKAGESYDPKNYLASMLNEGAGVKTETDRKADRQRKIKSEAVRKETQSLAKTFEQALEFRFWKAAFEKEQKVEDTELRQALTALEHQESLQAEFLERLEGEFAKTDFQAKAWESLVNGQAIRAFAVEKLKRPIKSQGTFIADKGLDYERAQEALNQIEKSAVYRDKLEALSRQLAGRKSPDFGAVALDAFPALKSDLAS